MPQVYSKFNRPKTKGQVFKKGSKVDKTGYVSAKQRIESLMNAGARLIQHRRDQNQAVDQEGEEVELTNPMPSVGKYKPDPFEVLAENKAVNERLKQQQKQAKNSSPSGKPAADSPAAGKGADNLIPDDGKKVQS